MFEDAAVEVLLRRLWDEAKENSPRGALFADSAWTLQLLVLRAAAGERFQPVPVRGGLAGWQERRATEYLASHMAEDVTLDALAGVAGLSTFHFARQFKQSTGLPPHAYLRRLRCGRAKDLLIATDLSITEIAAKVGYETPQAFARMFRAETGASPSDYRRGRR